MQDQLACNDPQAIGRLLEFERNLLELFRDKFDFFGVDEFDHLARLRHDRNRCAHPTFTKTNEPFRPTAELARLHIRNVVEYVISQPPKQGKAALDSLREVVLSTYFPSSHAARIERLRRTALGNPRPALTRAFVDELIFGFAKPEDKYFREGVVLGLIKVLIEMHRSDALERAVADTNKLLAEAGDEAVKAGVRIVLTVHEVGERIDASGKTVVNTWLEKEDRRALGKYVVRALGLPWLAEHARQQIKRLTSEQIADVSGKLPPEILDRAVKLYTGARNWNEANRLAAEVALPHVGEMNNEHLEKIFVSARSGEADLLGSRGFRDFMFALYKSRPYDVAMLDEMLDRHELNEYRPDGDQD